MSEKNTLVVGGTGTTGRRVVTALRARGVPVVTASRSGERRFDWQDRGTWDAALAGVEAMYVVPLDGALLTRPFVARAVALGVRRVVLLSARGVDVPDYGPADNVIGQTHVDGEDAVRTSGVDWTILRPGWFAQNFTEGFFRDAVAAGELRLSAGDGAASFVDAEDIAAVAVAALTEDGHAGQTYELSGPRAVTLAEAAAEISAASGRRVRYVPLAEGDYIAELVAAGLPEPDAADFAEVVRALRRGLDAHLSDGVCRALGRPPRDFGEFVKSATAAGAWPVN
ncbi:NAD(P)H-binding protein [Streptomyces litchfieldiae]|uniref:NAD(P)H-binding protein n=1 Tax=Streptomyces litchfieldiae TaxID=3075543 RepID=A0ABU2MLM1_9ACTN|nr:NAD(P)H-binding protein [Streptomyces sp. DSM 44938]MDT0342268.1 NAD(P)H-binding protein [Streptomyces sp. DSM 44938]